ncbi:E2F-associated phosphoprotein [Thecamonas trahens ATCC 50062]|uniref:E2F-associated phosphoprotein n=1 Tax=Thecamonas trahens ATCC 50062 TaxID=461836 RepID=A0A0L0DAH3_THETB|nr:E2F-associated phosphoprotein [Thecamonas trahens ATCC 50062]KNC48303.1 E2F-associated phosphoprotein [Thecamonas trahens ATCC 50062]|eukprot:XP_013758870.1 E2F-associated phosphoprotein [Thecamonas trahens ATCC 50062]
MSGVPIRSLFGDTQRWCEEDEAYAENDDDSSNVAPPVSDAATFYAAAGGSEGTPKSKSELKEGMRLVRESGYGDVVAVRVPLDVLDSHDDDDDGDRVEEARQVREEEAMEQGMRSMSLEERIEYDDAALAEEEAYEKAAEAGTTQVFSYDELLVDPDADDDNETWAQETYAAPANSPRLACPSCFTLLCVDCQQHERFPSQFRAMFVLSAAEIVPHQRLAFAPSASSSRRMKAVTSQGTVVLEGGDPDQAAVYLPVRCGVCSADVGVFDSDEIFHFFNVVVSN